MRESGKYATVTCLRSISFIRANIFLSCYLIIQWHRWHLLTVGRRKREGQISHGRKGLTRSTPWQEGGKEEKREHGRSDAIMTKQSGKYLCQNSLG